MWFQRFLRVVLSFVLFYRNLQYSLHFVLFCSISFHFRCIWFVRQPAHILRQQCDRVRTSNAWMVVCTSRNISLKLLSAMKTIINGFQLNQKTNQLSTVYICPFDTNSNAKTKKLTRPQVIQTSSSSSDSDGIWFYAQTVLGSGVVYLCIKSNM